MTTPCKRHIYLPKVNLDGILFFLLIKNKIEIKESEYLIPCYSATLSRVRRVTTSDAM